MLYDICLHMFKNLQRTAQKLFDGKWALKICIKKKRRVQTFWPIQRKVAGSNWVAICKSYKWIKRGHTEHEQWFEP